MAPDSGFERDRAEHCEGSWRSSFPGLDAWAFGTTGLPVASHLNGVRLVPSGLVNGCISGSRRQTDAVGNAAVGTVTG